MTGTVVNVVAIVVGGLIGMAVKQRITRQMNTTIIHAVGLVVALIGIQMALASTNIILPLVSLVIGGILGEYWDLERRLEDFSKWAEQALKSRESNFSQGFVASSLLFIVGPMAIVGSIADGLNGDYRILLTKAMLDGISSVAFASSLGAGVLFSTIPVFFYQGALTVGADFISQFFSDPVINEMTAAGGLLMLGLSINMLGLQKIRVGNLLPALVVIVILVKLLPLFAGLVS